MTKKQLNEKIHDASFHKSVKENNVPLIGFIRPHESNVSITEMIKESLEEKELQWSKDVVSKIQKIIVHALEMDEFHDASLGLAGVGIMLTPSNDSYTTKLSALPIIEAFLEFKKENISSQEQNRN